jgi:hypothetical protein
MRNSVWHTPSAVAGGAIVWVTSGHLPWWSLGPLLLAMIGWTYFERHKFPT